MDFVWNDEKALINFKKHGVSFLEATEVFSDEHSFCINDPDHSYDEDRYLLFGITFKGKYLVVSFTDRMDTIRIISARPMTRQERNTYEQ